MPMIRWAACVGLLLLGGCAVVPGEKRHSPAEIATYQYADFVAPIASLDGERLAREEALQTIRTAVALPPGLEAEGMVPRALWNIGFLNVEKPAGLALVLAALPDLADKDATYQRGILSAAYTLYASEAAPLVMPLLTRITTPREFAIAAYTLLQADDSPARRDFIRATLHTQFPNWRQEPRLQRLDYVLTTDLRQAIAARPPLVDLLAHPIRAGRPVVFSFQRQDRRRFGLAVVRGADGRFVRNKDGSVFHIAHLANAITNLPGTITNGNTPQGLFTIVGAGTATNKWIGPTPYLESKVPVEATLAEYEHVEKIENSWTEAAYEAFLPETWRGYTLFKEAYLAGQAGRDEMLMHGTTINSDYYRGASYFPGTPSAGCLVAMETWDAREGRMQTSDHLALIKAFTRDGHDRGYLVVVELDDRLAPVALADVLADVLAAEAGK